MATTSSQIDPALLPYLETGLAEAQKLFLTGPQPTFFPGQTYVSPSAQTLEALRQQEAAATGAAPLLQQAQQAYTSALGGTTGAVPLYQQIYQTAGQQPGVDIYRQAAQGAFAPSTQRFESLYNLAGQQPAADLYGQVAGGGFQNLALPGTAQVAAGGFLQGSPYQQAMMAAATRPLVQQYSEQVVPGIASGFSKAGRYGSGAMARAQGQAAESFARGLGDITSSIAAQDYARERAFQESARQQLAGLSQQDLTNRLAAAGALQSGQQAAIAQQAGLAGQLAGLSQQDLANRLAGVAGLSAAQQQQLAGQLSAAGGIGTVGGQELTRQAALAQAAPSFFQMGFLPAQALGQVGAAREQIAAQPIQEQMARFSFEQQAPRESLMSFLSSVYGSPLKAYGTQTLPAAQTNPLGSALGGAGLGYLGGTLLTNQFGPNAPLYGAGIGALGGLLF